MKNEVKEGFKIGGLGLAGIIVVSPFPLHS